MSKKPTVTTISSGYYSTTALNNNFTNIRDEFDNTLSLDGSTPNAMQADLDLNNNDILNVKELSADEITLDGTSIAAQADAAASSASAALTSENNAASSATEATEQMTRNVRARPANFNVLTSQRGDVFRVTAPVTASLPAAATAGDGFWFTLIADGNDVTIDPDGAELINVSPTLTVSDGTYVDVFCDGSDWRTSLPITGAERSKLEGLDQGVATTDEPVFAGMSLEDTLPILLLKDTDEVDVYGQLRHSAGATAIYSRDGASDGSVVFGGAGGGATREYGRFDDSGDLRLFEKLGIGSSPGFGHVLEINGDGAKADLLKISADTGTNTSTMEIEGPGSDVVNGNFQFGTSGTFSWSTGSNNGSLFLDIDGNMGVGTLTPAGKLAVQADQGTGEVIATLVADLPTTGTRSLNILAPETDSASAPFIFSTGNSMTFRVDATDALNIANDGKVGVKNTDPDADLDVNGTFTSRGTTNLTGEEGDGLRIVQSSGKIFLQPAIGSSTSALSFSPLFSTSPYLFIADDGKVGVKTNTPTEALDVDGNIEASGSVKTGATTVASLPSASTLGAGTRYFVTDANATTFASVVAGGGSNGVPVYSDGTDWRIG